MIFVYCNFLFLIPSTRCDFFAAAFRFDDSLRSLKFTPPSLSFSALTSLVDYFYTNHCSSFGYKTSLSIYLNANYLGIH
jgi:hypothetical protein